MAVYPLAVVAGIVEKDGRILVARRKADSSQGLKWEFPGGKIEKGETPEQALRRELTEELGITVTVGWIYDARLWEYPEKSVLLLFYRAALESGTPVQLDSGGFEWTSPADIMNYDFADADTATAQRIAEGEW